MIKTLIYNANALFVILGSILRNNG